MSGRRCDKDPLSRSGGHLVRFISIVTAALLVVGGACGFTAAAAQATITTDAASAAAMATAAGYRTGIAVLDLQTGAYYGAGQDTASFASESVVKVMIAAELLITGQMTGDDRGHRLSNDHPVRR